MTIISLILTIAWINNARDAYKKGEIPSAIYAAFFAGCTITLTIGIILFDFKIIE